MQDKLIIAVQKSGRLSERTSSLLAEAGIAFANGSNGRLKSTATNFPLEVLYLRDDDIPECVGDGIADAGIVGENVLLEHGGPIEVVERLGFGRCRLSIAVPRDAHYESLSDLQNKVVATTYPGILQRYAKSHDVSVTVRRITGSTEVAPSIGMADAICDLVSTGSTLISNGLREVESVLESEAVLASGRTAKAKQDILDRLVFRIRAVLNARDFRYILLNCPNQAVQRISSLLPGIKSPTVMPLAIEGWSSLHTVVREAEFWHIVEAVRDAGAEGILVLPIQRMVT